MSTILERTYEEKVNHITYNLTVFYHDGEVDRISDVTCIIKARRLIFGGKIFERYECDMANGKCKSIDAEAVEKILASPSNNHDKEIELTL